MKMNDYANLMFSLNYKIRYEKMLHSEKRLQPTSYLVKLNVHNKVAQICYLMHNKVCFYILIQ